MCITMKDLFPDPKTTDSNYSIFVEEVDKITGVVVGHQRSKILIRSWCVEGKWRICYKCGDFFPEKFDSRSMADRHIEMVLTKR